MFKYSGESVYVAHYGNIDEEHKHSGKKRDDR